MPVVIVAAVLAAAAGAWMLRRASEAPIMRRRINAGSDEYFAEREAERLRDGSGDDSDSPDVDAGHH